MDSTDTKEPEYATPIFPELSVIPKEFCHNPRQIIEGRLLDLHNGGPDEMVSTSDLRDVFVGDLKEWVTFEKDVAQLYYNPAVQNAFDRCNNVAAGLNLVGIQAWDPDFADLRNQIQISDEYGVLPLFQHDAVRRTKAAVRQLFDSYNPETEDAKPLKSLPLADNIGIGIAKIVNKGFRFRYKPYVSVMTPGDGDNQEERMIGEMKFFTTCNISGLWYEDDSLQDCGTKRHIFAAILGQVARNMKARGLRFGFVSTYLETVFLKVVIQSDGQLALHYSQPIRHTQSVIESISTPNKLEKISVRLAILYLIRRVSGDDKSEWRIEQSTLDKTVDWTEDKAYVEEESQGTDDETPNTRPQMLATQTRDKANMFPDHGSLTEEEPDEPESPSMGLSRTLDHMSIVSLAPRFTWYTVNCISRDSSSPAYSS
ncbi:hypothetical protein PtrEW4_008660 [Pyrenophora tritici-repentis]|nr:hypothetical protein Alg215_07862 [Pyrenophora tritici-repentis]KAI1531869.1 hypothetical protein PtrSN001C_008170 [Pyrenophora tritici-repentis]KAI1564691.1 hypothetical protein PtrEW4_008660 [Pyrenophora tritici-repentis]KAI1584575.1 hypothetical protein PtrEW13061_008384 [Pyrenophora tritici-repentis]